MNDVIRYLKEQVKYFRIAVNMSRYSTKSTAMQNRLGRLWEILDPLVQLGINYLIFGYLMHRVVPDFPALPWMFIGMGVYGFARNVVIHGSKSMVSQFKLASKMKYPLSITPLSTAFGFLTEFYIMVGAGFALAIHDGYMPSLYWIQILYYFACLVVFSLSLSLLCSTIIIVFPDFKFFMNYIFRLLMYFSGTVFALKQFKQIPAFLINAQILNPFYYLIEGFRDAAFGTQWFWHNGIYNFSFWAITLVILIVAANAHMKIRDRISDFI